MAMIMQSVQARDAGRRADAADRHPAAAAGDHAGLEMLKMFLHPIRYSAGRRRTDRRFHRTVAGADGDAAADDDATARHGRTSTARRSISGWSTAGSKRRCPIVAAAARRAGQRIGAAAVTMIPAIPPVIERKRRWEMNRSPVRATRRSHSPVRTSPVRVNPDRIVPVRAANAKVDAKAVVKAASRATVNP